MTTCYIVDDEQHAIDVLSRYIQNTPGLELKGAEDNPLHALNAITSGKASADITFLDVDMPQLSGIDLAGLINGCTTVVFTTAYPDYAYQAFDKDAVDYLLKPISYERFLRAIAKVKEALKRKQTAPAEEQNDEYFYIKADVKGKYVKVSLADIIYVEAMQNYVRIQTPSEKLTTYLSMKEIEEHLPAAEFTRVHKSFIVSNAKVRSVEGNLIMLTDENTVSLGRSYRTAFLEMINAKLLKSKRAS
ncbi:LytR/AlgR family response regulator transcription factor [Pontibacter mangrovi]|uniref:Response regulator transcription factor n=1 Tax=Pontibacter mangrovi TaxID=2589816 RepID=A0A501VZT9_9BACT|nr:LytTR family DNA-binding domain-containing protein [Pontibacter mangrovi]TPE42558.1 response regulator transcription factor [Pontibacter mangrovi]